MNLQTGKKMKVPSKRVPKCKFSMALKEEIAQKKQFNKPYPHYKMHHQQSQRILR